MNLKMLWLGFLYACLLLAPPLPAHAATLTVTNGNDSGAGSLRATIAAASAGDTITFAANVTAITLTTGEIAINKNLTLRGPGVNQLAISGNDASRIFNIGNVNVAISGMTLTRGHATDSPGGAILAIGDLTLTNVAITRCTTTDSGGGIHFAGNALTMTNVTLSENFANEGGGLYMLGTRATWTNGLVQKNSATYSGGGISNTWTMTLVNVTFDQNEVIHPREAIGGGAIINLGALTMLNNAITRNLSTTDGGGIFNYGDSTMTLTNVSMFENKASSGSGGGIFNAPYVPQNQPRRGVSARPRAPRQLPGDATLINLTIHHNDALSGGGIHNQGTLVAINTIISDSSDANCAGLAFGAGSTNNAATDASCGTSALQTSRAALKLGALTCTPAYFPLLAGSVAIDAGTNTRCPATDIRGMTRPRGLRCDIGAYEYDPPAPAEVPEADTLLLLGGGLGGLATWLRYQWSRRKIR